MGFQNFLGREASEVADIRSKDRDLNIKVKNSEIFKREGRERRKGAE
jgi:hypothetical protein